MKRKIFLAVALLLLTACERDTGTPSAANVRAEKGYNVKVIDGCEYIEVDTGAFRTRLYSLTHKGNCKNPIHSCATSSEGAGRR
jgi:hypothetical protein